jgi:hypothetical protein
MPTSYPKHISFNLQPLYFKERTFCKYRMGALHDPRTEPDSSGKKNCVAPLRNSKMKFQLLK